MAVRIASRECRVRRAWSLDPEWIAGPAIIKALECWAGRGTFAGTLCNMARQSIVDELRNLLGRTGSCRSRNQGRVVSFEELSPKWEPVSAGDVSARAEADCAAMMQVLDSAPLSHRQRVVVRAVLRGGSQRAAARRLRVTEGAISRALGTVRALVN